MGPTSVQDADPQLALFNNIEFNAAAIGKACMRRDFLDHGVKELSRHFDPVDVFLAAWPVEPPVNLDEALGLVEAAIACDPSITDATRQKYSKEIARLVASARLLGASTVEEIDAEFVDELLALAGRTRRGDIVDPRVATLHNRRAALRYFFTRLRALGIDLSNPTQDVQLPPRPTEGVRPLTNDEMRRCEEAALDGLVPGARPVAVALAQAGAATGEIPLVRVEHLDLGARRVELPGSGTTRPRRNTLTPWACSVLIQRIRAAEAKEPLAVGSEVSPASAANMVSGYLREALRLAGIHDVGVGPASIRAWGARKEYERTRLIEAAANFLGSESLDRTASLIKMEWRESAF